MAEAEVAPEPPAPPAAPEEATQLAEAPEAAVRHQAEETAVAFPSDEDLMEVEEADMKPEKPDDRLLKVKGLDKQQLCIDLLMVGCVQSYVDFFYITHRKAPPKEGSSEEVKDVVIPEETLIFLKETLEQAETARRLRSYLQCYESYNSLAEFFEKVPDLKSAMYFYQRCADVAAEVDAWESISKANLNLGSCEEQGGNWQSAMQYHEKALEIATSADSLPLQIKAASRLTTVCQVLAEQCEKDGQDVEAAQLYERCLSSAQLSKDAALEGSACHKLGLSKHKTGNYEQAVELQKQYLEICRREPWPLETRRRRLSS
ncbi:unnamed protein product [Effrenium voratum]|nr:unnamed protein product [Effrenium voratum]